MCQLLDLPNELLLDVISVVRVDDIEAFTSCNKRLRALSHDVLQEHREMKMKYSTIRCTSMPASQGVMDVRLPVFPVVWLYEIILNKTVASYPTRLIIHDISNYRNDPTRGHGITTNYLSYDKLDARIGNVDDQLRLKLEQCPYIQAKDMDTWMQDPPWIDFDTALALLLSLLPNLQSIFTGGIRFYIPRTEYMLARIAEANKRHNHDSNPLSRLVSVDRFEQPSNEWAHKKIHFYLSFTDFPSIRRIGGRGVDGRTDWTAFAMSHNYPPSQGKSRNDSKITDIKFSFSNISSDCFENLFGRISALQSFEYEYHAASIDGFGEFELCRIVASLLANASHSLVHLDLTIVTRYLDDRWKMIYLHGQIFIGSFREFQVLKTIRANNTMFIERVASPGLIGKKICKTHRLVDLLPKSIEDLQLVDIEINEDVHSSGIFDGLVGLKAQNLPNLKKINLDYFDPVAPDLKAAFSRERGVDFTFIPKWMMDK